MVGLFVTNRLHEFSVIIVGMIKMLMSTAFSLQIDSGMGRVASWVRVLRMNRKVSRFEEGKFPGMSRDVSLFKPH